jgi:hypothetical protein
MGCVLAFSGCDNGSTDDDEEYGGEVKTLEFNSYVETEGNPATGTRYYSLSTGLEVTDPAKIASKDWDLAFERSRFVYTNSGATATDLNSNGNGGVWHTDKEVLADVVKNDAIENDPLYGPYNTDVIRWRGGMGGATEVRLNILTYVGYGNEADQEGQDPATAGDGLTEEKAFSAPYEYNKKQFYTTITPTTYRAVPQVYIIKHGDGVHYSKIQFDKYESHSDVADAPEGAPAAAFDHYEISYQNF